MYATGPVAPEGSFVCPLSRPEGPWPAIDGGFTHDTVHDCLNGPDACTKPEECTDAGGKMMMMMMIMIMIMQMMMMMMMMMITIVSHVKPSSSIK